MQGMTAAPAVAGSYFRAFSHRITPAKVVLAMPLASTFPPSLA